MDRIIILALVAVLVMVLILAGRALAAAQRRKLGSTAPSLLWQALRAAPDGRPTVVAFSSPGCGVCKATQAPAIERLENTLGTRAVRILNVDIASDPEIASAFGILTVPTTVVLTPVGKVLTSNNGFAPFPRLVEQVRAASAA